MAPLPKALEPLYGSLCKAFDKSPDSAREEGMNITPSKIQEIISSLEDSDNLMPGTTAISEEEETEIYARALWEILRRDILSRLTSHVEEGVNL